ncbi:MAG: hemerythrin domain-containing protein [Pseudomonadota bacterium]
MTTIDDVMTAGHRTCDRYFAEAEAAVADEDWFRAEDAWSHFSRVLDKHFTRFEEELLFPAFEEVNGPYGPTQMMRMEHAQIRTLEAQMRSVLSARDRQEFLGLAETLMLLIQQHNMKEEQILYPMMDQSLANAADFVTELTLD